MSKKGAVKKNKPELLIRQENKSVQTAMWLSVFFFTVIIFILWGWSTKIMIENVNLEKTPENILLQNTQIEWNNIFNDDQSATQTVKTELLKKQNDLDEKNKKIISDKIKTVLDNAFSSSTATSTTTSTLETTTSTTTTINSTNTIKN